MDPTTGFDVVTPISEGMASLVSQAMEVIGAVAPGAIAIVGAILAIRIGIGVFRTLVGR